MFDNQYCAGSLNSNTPDLYLVDTLKTDKAVKSIIPILICIQDQVMKMHKICLPSFESLYIYIYLYT